MDLKALLEGYGLSAGIAVWVLIGLAQLLKNSLPDMLGFFKKDYEDAREFKQKRVTEDAKIKNLEYLSAMGSRTYTEEQLTMMTAEAQTQLSEANEYIRKGIGDKLDVALQKIDTLESRVDGLPEKVVDDLRADLRAIAENWRVAMLEYRHVQTKLTIMTTLFRENYEEITGKSIDVKDE